MTWRNKPRVTVKSVADAYASPNERIIEIGFSNGAGCLISLKQPTFGQGDTDATKARVEVYRTDGLIDVVGPKTPKPQPEAPSPVRQTSCRYCGLDVEAFTPYKRGSWTDRGGENRCPDGKLHRGIL